MKRILLILFLTGLLPGALRAQSVGRVHYGSRVFSTNFPAKLPDEYFENDGPKMPKERREIALRCIERTFGKVKENKEYWGSCTGSHEFRIILESGDELWFDDGCLGAYTMVSSRFTIASDMFPGGLKVGRKPPARAKKGVVLCQNEKNPDQFDFWWEETDALGHYTLDENGLIKEIGFSSNDC